jgi:hypothetical protein
MKYIFLLILLAIPCFANSLTIEFENDMLYHSDEKYTHGTRITYGPISFGQNIYTPSDLEISVPIPNERPYAGILYFSYNQDIQYDRCLHQIEYMIGTVGKYSFADETQTTIHEWSDSDIPAGWEYQVDDGILLQINDKLYFDIFANNYVSAKSYVGTELGTVFINVGIGANLIVGYNIPKIINKHMMSKASDFSIYTFADIYDRYILFNKLLISDYTDIEKEDNVLDIRYGIGIAYKMLELQYSVCHRSKEYKEQDYNASFAEAFIKINL